VNWAWWLCAAAFIVPMSLTSADAQRPAGAAWLVRSIDGSAPRREANARILDTPLQPGSLIKTVTLAAALESRVIEPRTAHVCRRVVTVNGRRYACSHPDLKRPLTAAEALAHSCNDFFVSLAARLSPRAVNDVRAGVGLPPLDPRTDFAAALVGLDGSRVTARVMLDAIGRLLGVDRRRPATVSDATRRVLVEGMRGAAAYGSASELAAVGITALAKTGTAAMPGGGVHGLLVAFVPADAPTRAVVVVAPGAAGRDAVSIAAELLRPPAEHVSVGVATAAGRTRVDSLDLEEYVARVVTGESQPGAPAAAREALAIAARTFVLANRGRHRSEGFDVCDTTHCQALRPAAAAGRRAAVATAGQIMVDASHRPAAVQYSAWCGGHSELPANVWPGSANRRFDRSGPDDACAGEPAWTSEVGAAGIERALRAAGLEGSRLTELSIAQRSLSGRAIRIRAAGFVPPELPAEEFRMALGRTGGWQLLKSTLFDLRRTPRGYRFTGRGAGHGVGMCVIGAGARAANGATAAQILGFYYPTLRVTPLTAARAGEGIELALPAAEESERPLVLRIIRSSLDELSTAVGVTPPAPIRITVHPDVTSFSRATARPWWTAGATDGAAISLLPIGLLRRHGQLERTIAHELAHVMLDSALAGKPLWVREGAAVHFSGARLRPPHGDARCPSDAELAKPRDAAAHRDAYARAAACVVRELAAGRSWRDIG
jgi:SpoIID/LytB domain protein